MDTHFGYCVYKLCCDWSRSNDCNYTLQKVRLFKLSRVNSYNLLFVL